MSKPVAIVMVTFGRDMLLNRTLKSLFATIDDQQCSVTIVDNGSQDRVKQTLLRYQPHIDQLVLLRENRGKPYAWNLGAQVAREQCKVNGVEPPTYYLFCDSDLEFKPGWLPVMLETYAQHKELPLCGLSGYVWPPQLQSAEQRQGKTRAILVHRFPPGCCVLIAANTFDKLGPWDTKRLIRTVDTSFFREAHRQGWYNGSVCPNSVIEHIGAKQRTWRIDTGAPKLLD